MKKNPLYKDVALSGAVAGSALGQNSVRLLRDRWADFSDQEVRKYFDEGYAVFIEKLESFKNSAQAPTMHEEKELMLMLDSLLYAKSILCRQR